MRRRENSGGGRKGNERLGEEKDRKKIKRNKFGTENNGEFMDEGGQNRTGGGRGLGGQGRGR